MRKNKGITLVALVVTIVVLLILAAVSINLVLGQNGLIANAKEAREKSKNATDEESQLLNGTIPDYIAEQVNGTTNGGGSTGGGETPGGGNTPTEPETPSGTVTISGTTITSANLRQYLGKKVQYTPATPSTSYGTSTTYRLFYVDFANDFGDGAGTIYLKADYGEKNISLASYTSYQSTDSYAVMKKINPSWIQPETLQTNDKCVSWLADPNVWNGWKDTSLTSKTNYVVGSPSLEMYVKSYNAYLDANPDLEKNGGTNKAEKLACEYVTSGYSAKGYRIGFLNTDKGSWANTGYYQAENSLIKPTTAADKMYNPGSSTYYWLASPSAYDSNTLMYVDGNISRVGGSGYGDNLAVCPLVSLKSDVTLKFVTE